MGTFTIWLKNQFKHLIISKSEIIMAMLVFSLVISGVAVAAILRFLEFDGLIILFCSIIIELICISLLYFFLKGFLISEEQKNPIKKGKLNNL